MADDWLMLLIPLTAIASGRRCVAHAACVWYNSIIGNSECWVTPCLVHYQLVSPRSKVTGLNCCMQSAIVRFGYSKIT